MTNDSTGQAGANQLGFDIVKARCVVRDWLGDGRADETTYDWQLNRLLKRLSLEWKVLQTEVTDVGGEFDQRLR